MTLHKDTLFYDGQCPLCRSEMEVLAKLKREDLELIDIHDDRAPGLPARERLLKVLHLRTRDGEWITGIDATVRAWSSTRVGGLWRLLNLPGVRPVADKLYSSWARRRYQRRYGS